MRSYDSATLAAIAAGDVKARHLVWITAKNRDTGEPESLGLWNGDQSETIEVGGQDRLFIAAGSLLDVGLVEMRAGPEVRMHTISLSPLNEAVALAIRGYEPRFAPITVWRALYDLTRDRITGTPHRLIEGWVDELTITRGAVGGESGCEVRIASSARAGTRFGGGAKSEAHLGVLYKYADISGAVQVKWG